MATLPPGTRADLPAEVESLAWLLGTWRGEGRGQYPSVDDFEYVDESEFACDGSPVVTYVQRSHLVDGKPSHGERGYLRSQGARDVEGVLAGSLGTLELYEGETDGRRRLTLVTTQVLRSPSAEDVRALRHVYELADDGALHVRVDMEAVGHPMGLHLEAVLRRA